MIWYLYWLIFTEAVFILAIIFMDLDWDLDVEPILITKFISIVIGGMITAYIKNEQLREMVTPVLIAFGVLAGLVLLNILIVICVMHIKDYINSKFYKSKMKGGKNKK